MTNLVAGTLDDALDYLAKLAADRRTRPPTYAEKQAVAASDVLGSLGSALKENPVAGGAVLGGGLGAGLGGLTAAMGNRERDPSQRRSILGGALTGGLAGAGVGGGIGLASHGLKNLNVAPPGVGGGAGGGAGLPPGVFMAGGKKMQLDPEALKANPGLADEVRKLTTRTGQTYAAGGLLGLLNRVHDAAPVSTSFLAPTALADAALHNPLFGFARTAPTDVGGRVGRELLAGGANESKTLAEPLKNAIIENKPVGGGVRAGGKASGNVLDILGGGKKIPGKGGQNVLEVDHTPMMEQKTKSHAIDPATGKPDPGRYTETAGKVPAGPPETAGMNRGVLGSLKAQGYGKSRFVDKQLYQLPFTSKSYAGKALPLALAGRAAVYGGIPFGEYMARGLADDMSSESKMQELMRKYTKPVEGQ